jgi:hypothetical protein
MIFMAKYKNEKFESLKSLIPYDVENLSDAKGYSTKVLGSIEAGLRKVGRGIKEAGSFYKKHPIDTVGTAAAVGAEAYTGSQLVAALSDPDVRYDLGFSQVPKGTTILPLFHNPWNFYHQYPIGVTTESVWKNPANAAGVVLPFLIPLVTLGVEGVSYYLWKKSIKNIEKKSQT